MAPVTVRRTGFNGLRKSLDRNRDSNMLRTDRSRRSREPLLCKARKHACPRCPSAFGSKMELEEHENSHTGVKPFICDVCQNRFNRRSTLWNHKRIHLELKPFQCPICKLEFKWKNSLKCHRDTHLRRKDAGAELFDEEAIRNMSFTGAARYRRRASYNRRNFRKQEKIPEPIVLDENFFATAAICCENMKIANEIEIKSDEDDIKGLIVIPESPPDWSQSLFITRCMAPTVRPSSCVSLPTVCLPDDPEIIEKYFATCQYAEYELCNENVENMYVVDQDAELVEFPDGAYFLNLSYVSDYDAYVPSSGGGGMCGVVDHEAYSKVLPVEQW